MFTGYIFCFEQRKDREMLTVKELIKELCRLETELFDKEIEGVLYNSETGEIKLLDPQEEVR